MMMKLNRKISRNQHKEEDLRKGKRRKVFRDEEDRMIGGVCSGMANYFDISVFWSRIIFIGILFLIGPGAPFLYLMFWIALPSAKTTAEKLEMKGEKVNINNIEKNIKDELNIIENKILDFDKKYTKEIFGANSFFRKIVDFCIRVITGYLNLQEVVLEFFAFYLEESYFSLFSLLYSLVQKFYSKTIQWLNMCTVISLTINQQHGSLSSLEYQWLQLFYLD